MTERVLARIWIGGQLRRSQANELVLAVCRSRVSVGAPGWEHVLCQPVSIDGIIETTDGVLHLQDLAAPDGEMPILTQACCELGLTYRLWHESVADEGCMVELWAPGMEEPLRLHGDPTDPHMELIESLPVKLAINHLREGEVERALFLLERACPELPELQPLVVIDD